MKKKPVNAVKNLTKPALMNRKLVGQSKAIQSHLKSAGKRNQSRRDSKNA
jgi:hypothetical protein